MAEGIRLEGKLAKTRHRATSPLPSTDALRLWPLFRVIGLSYPRRQTTMAGQAGRHMAKKRLIDGSDFLLRLSMTVDTASPRGHKPPLQTFDK